MNAADKLAYIEARAQAATEGPWRADDEHGLIPDSTPAWTVSRTNDSEDFLGDVAYMPQRTDREQEDAEFIAHARQDVPALVAALRAVIRELDITIDVGDVEMVPAADLRAAIEEALS